MTDLFEFAEANRRRDEGMALAATKPARKKWHRQSKTPTYKCWLKMRERCTNPKAFQWKWYGGRGIAVCDRWLNSFAAFLADMGKRPSMQHTLDRHPNADGNYEPNNVRWATKREQIDNQKKTIWIDLAGEHITLREACRRRGIPFMRAYKRYRLGCDLTAVLSDSDLRCRGTGGRRW